VQASDPSVDDVAAQLLEDRVEVPLIADLEDESPVVRRFDEVARMADVGHHRLLDEHVDAPLETGERLVVVEGVWRHDTHRIQFLAVLLE
jgi:hypothetical protein